MLKNKKLAFSLIELSIVILIIGILIAGVTQGSRLVRQSAIKAAQNLTRSSAVNSMPGLVLWLEPTLENTIISAANSTTPEDGDLVSSWNDINLQSTTLISVSQAISANQPLYLANGINKLPAVKFSNSSNTRLSSNTVPLAAGASSYSLIAVWKPSLVTPASGYLIFSQGKASSSSANNRQCGIYISPTSQYGFHGANNNYVYDTAVINTSYITVITVNNNLANNISIYTNSNTPTTGASNNPGSLSLLAEAFSVGSVSYNNNWFDGLISEVIIFDRMLKKSEITDINQYLSKKYAISIN
jgi:prepilin-type N-terminal cleavage/methylation domain-containing protein